jgi:Cu/Ag efflux pump CusA
MTSFAFLLGVVPPAPATGAGAEMRRALGGAVDSGMLGGALLGVYPTPALCALIRRLDERRTPAPGATTAPQRLPGFQAGASEPPHS